MKTKVFHLDYYDRLKHMSVYTKIFDAVEEAVFVKQFRNAEDVARYVSSTTGIRNVNVSEIDKIIHKVATQYKQA